MGLSFQGAALIFLVTADDRKSTGLFGASSLVQEIVLPVWLHAACASRLQTLPGATRMLQRWAIVHEVPLLHVPFMFHSEQN